MFAVFKQKPDKITSEALKTIGSSVIFLAILLLIVLVYAGLYEVVNFMDVKAYFRYASDGKFEEDFYFKNAEESGTEIFSTLYGIVPNENIPSRMQDYFKMLLEHEKELREKFNSNNEYLKYLQSNDTTVNDVISYMKKIVSLDEIFLHAGMYIGMLIFILILYFWYKWRIRIFIISGMLYFILVIDSFMSGIFLDAFYPVLRNVLERFNENNHLLSYEEYITLSKKFLPATREAALTFIILDTVVQSIKDTKKRKISSRFLTAYFELEFTLKFLDHMKNDLVVTNLKTVDLEAIYSLCKEDKLDHHLVSAKEKLDELRSIIKNEKMTVFKLQDKLSSINSDLKKSKYIRENIVR